LLPARAVLARPTSPSAGPLAVPSALQLVGNTPLIEIRRTRDGVAPAVRILGKLEGFNPGGSVKDRPALKMIEDGPARGRLGPGNTILDSTSGDTGIALAMVGAAPGYPVELVMPGNVSKERQEVVAGFGAQAIFSAPLEGLKHMASSIVPGIYHEAELDRKLGIETEDAYNMVCRLGREEGLLLGQSSGAAQVAALEVARGLREGTVVVLFPDFGDRYLSTNLWIGWGKLGGTTP